METPLIFISLLTTVMVVWIVWPERMTDLPGVFRVAVIVLFLAVVLVIGLGHTVINSWPVPAEDARASQRGLR